MSYERNERRDEFFNERNERRDEFFNERNERRGEFFNERNERRDDFCCEKHERRDDFCCEKHGRRDEFCCEKREHRERFCNIDNEHCMRKVRMDIREIREGLGKVCRGVKEVEKGCICDGELEILEGICIEERGLRCLEEDLKHLRLGPCHSMEEAEEGLCHIREGIKDEKHGLAELLECEFCEGMRQILEGVHDVEKGIKEILCAIEKFD